MGDGRRTAGTRVCSLFLPSLASLRSIPAFLPDHAPRAVGSWGALDVDAPCGTPSAWEAEPRRETTRTVCPRRELRGDGDGMLRSDSGSENVYMLQLVVYCTVRARVTYNTMAMTMLHSL